MNEKAVSPIISTVLIIVVAIALTTMLLSWGQNFIQKTTTEADSTIDTSCNGASITISSCDYNSIGNTLKFVMINSGEIAFNTDNNFSLTMIDADKDLNNSNINILSSKAFNVGESEQITISSYDATIPIDLTIRSSKCPGYFWSTSCD